MTHQPQYAADGATDLPPVDQVIHDARESSGHLRSPEETADPTAHLIASGAAVPAPTATTGPAASPAQAAPAGPAVSVPATLPPAAAHAVPAPGAHAAGVASADHHASADHGDAHGHAHADTLGPLDTGNWTAGIAGVLVGLLIVACFAIATQGLGAY